MRTWREGDHGSVDLLPTSSTSPPIGSAPTAKLNGFLNGHPFQRIALSVAMFGGVMAFGVVRLIHNNTSQSLPWWSDTCAAIGAIAVMVVLGYAFQRRLLVRSQGQSNIKRITIQVLVFVLVILPLTLAFPRRYGNGYAFPARIQAIGDGMTVAVGLVILVTVAQSTLRQRKARGLSQGFAQSVTGHPAATELP
jgi:hypothetical protein